MPNWCENIVVIGHPDQKMQERLVGAYERGKLGQEFLPMPEEYHKDARWYDWRNANWGTKWDFGQGEHGCPPVHRDGRVELRFDTAWLPPFQFYLELRRLGFDIDVSYYEPGVGGCGRIVNDDHRCFGIDCWNPDCVRRFVDPDLVERFAIDEGSRHDEEDGPCAHGDEQWFDTSSLEETVMGYRDLRAKHDAMLKVIAGMNKQP